MTSESMGLGRRSAVLATVIGAVLAAYSGGASALDFEFDNGVRLNWNTTLSAGASWRAQAPSKLLYTYGDGSLIGKYNGTQYANTPFYGYVPGTELPGGNGRAGNWAAGESTLNYDQFDMFSAPFKLISDIEIKKNGFGGLVRFKAWYDYALNNNKVNIGNQANNMNGARVTGPTPPNCASTSNATAFACIPMSPPLIDRWPKKKLSDSGFEDEQKFSNIYLLDAYLYGTIPVGDTSLQVRLGNQVINWGESVFIQGVNQINPIDVPAARRAGAELKEILLPVWAAYINWGLPFGSLEAFYQLKWNNTSIDGCGTYWAVTSSIISTSPGKCNQSTAFGSVLGTPAAQFGSAAWLQAQGLYVPLGKGKDASDSGQYGIALRFPVEKLDTEFGLYAMNIHSRLPVISSRAGTSPNDLTPQQQAALGAVGLWSNACGPAFRGGACYTLGTSRVTAAIPIIQAGAAAAGQAILGSPILLDAPNSLWEYPEDIQVYGLSTASNLFGWSISSELSYHKDVPVQVNGNDLLLGLFTLNGPFRDRGYEAYAAGSGAFADGYDRFDKTQFQVNGVKTYSNLLGADNMLIVGEVGMQWNNVPDYKKDNVRYGRGFMWGYGSAPGYGISIPPTGGSTCSPTFTNAPTIPAGTLYNPSPRGCKNSGYITDFAWGYRLRVSADYLNVGNSGITMTPSIFWSQDVDGISMDPAFQEDKTVLGLGMKFTYNKKYVLDFNYVTYADSGYDPLQDRDYYSLSASVTF
jgi:hypothetical protein